MQVNIFTVLTFYRFSFTDNVLWEWQHAEFKGGVQYVMWYVLYVALHEVYIFYIRASIEVYIKYLEPDPDPIL